MPPGWEPEADASPHTGVAGEPAVRFAPPVPHGVAAYVVVQFVPVVAVTSALMIVAPGAAGPRHWIAAALVLATTLVWGALFERKRWALPLELARLGAIVAVAGVAWTAGEIGAAAAVGVTLFAVGSSVWIAHVAFRARRSVDPEPALSWR
jgi:hypothetical protein